MLVAVPARAELQLHWLAPDSCAEHPPIEELAASGEGRAEVQIREEASKWIVTVLFFEPEQGLRRVATTSCAEAVRTAALLIKLGSHGALPVEAPPSPPLLTSAAAEPEPNSPLTPAPPPWRLSVGVGPALDVASFPTVEPRIAINAAASRSLVRIALDARVGFPRKLTAELTALRVVELQGAGCLNLEWRWLSIAPCVAAAVASWSVTAAWGKSRTVATSAISGQLRAALHLDAGLELGLLGGARLNVARPAPVIDGETVAAMPLVTGDLQATVGWVW